MSKKWLRVDVSENSLSVGRKPVLLIIPPVVIFMHLLLLSFSCPPCQALLLLHAHSLADLLLVHWETYLFLSVSTRLDGGGCRGLAVKPGSQCSRKKEKWNPVPSAQRGARQRKAWRSTGPPQPALRGEEHGHRAP